MTLSKGNMASKMLAEQALELLLHKILLWAAKFLTALKDNIRVEMAVIPGLLAAKHKVGMRKQRCGEHRYFYNTNRLLAL